MSTDLVPELCPNGQVQLVAPCGTPAAYRRHRRRGEEPCDECKAAVAEDERSRYRAQPKGTDRAPAPPDCPNPSPGGVARHRRAGELPCSACLSAYNAAQRERRAEASTARLQPCGTPAAARRHRRRGEPLCEPCKEAERAGARQQRQRAATLEPEAPDTADAGPWLRWWRWLWRRR